MNSQNVNVNFCPGCGLNIEAHRLAMVYAQERNRLNALVDGGNGGDEVAVKTRTHVRRLLGLREIREMPVLPALPAPKRRAVRARLTAEDVKNIQAKKRPGVGVGALAKELNLPASTVTYALYGYDKYHKTKGTKR